VTGRGAAVPAPCPVVVRSPVLMRAAPDRTTAARTVTAPLCPDPPSGPQLDSTAVRAVNPCGAGWEYSVPAIAATVEACLRPSA